MKKLSGDQAGTEALITGNTKHVFGLIGSATMEMFDTLRDAKEMNFIDVHNECTGFHMADGYDARASGHPSVILVGQNGSGTTNLVTGLS